MSDPPAAKPLWRKAEIEASGSAHLRHPWNPNSDIFLKRLSVMAGLGRSVVTLARVPPGRESFVYHAHECTEEWLYILSGAGKAEIDGKAHAVGAGDFLGFPAPSVAHHLINDGETDLVYLMGGERKAVDVGYFPRHGKTMVFSQSGLFAVDDDARQAMTFDDYIVQDQDREKD